MPPKADKTPPTREQVDAKIEDYKRNGYTFVAQDKIVRTITKLPAGARIAYVTKDDYEHRNGTKVGRLLRPGGWLAAKDTGKTPKWVSLFATGPAGRISWSVQLGSLESILYRLKLEDKARQPKGENVERYAKLAESDGEEEA